MCTNELIAKEAMYHLSCYKNCTCCNYENTTVDENDKAD